MTTAAKLAGSGGTTVSSPLTSSNKQSSTISIIGRRGKDELPPDGVDLSRGGARAGVVDARNAELQQCSISGGSS